MEEILIFFSAETAFVNLMKLGAKHQREYLQCIHTSLYLACHSDGVYRRDACRLVILLVLGEGKPADIRKCYRESVMALSIDEQDDFAMLDHYVRSEMRLLNPQLVRLVADQPPLSANERQVACQTKAAWFTSRNDSEVVDRLRKANGRPSGLLGRLAAGLGLFGGRK